MDINMHRSSVWNKECNTNCVMLSKPLSVMAYPLTAHHSKNDRTVPMDNVQNRASTLHAKVRKQSSSLEPRQDPDNGLYK